MSEVALPITNNDDANTLLEADPLALLLGMLLDQQIPMEWAFESPHRLKERMGGSLDASVIASYDPDEFEKLFKGPPALHRFPGSMGKRTQAMCQHLVENYEGRAEAVWESAESGKDLLKRLKAMPGFGPDKSKIFIALLGKRFGRAPEGWKEAAGVFGDDQPRSVADIDSADALAAVRVWKKAMKAKGKTKSDPA